MWLHTSLAALAAAVAFVNAHAIEPDSLQPRAFAANSPNGYTPTPGTCPSVPLSIRAAGQLSPNEADWLPIRRNATLEPMRDLLGRLNITGFDAVSYINSHQNNASALPNVAIACSGGGYRAMMNCGGVLEAFDSRTPNSTAAGHVGGLLQSATYLAGLSGGSWAVGTLYANNFTSIYDVLDSDSIWQLDNSIFEGPSTLGIQLLDTIGYFAAIQRDVGGKKDAGYNTTITDYWGRALSYQLINASSGGPGYTFSSVARQDFFTSGSVPLPVVLADSRNPGEMIISTNATVYEFNPWEFGTSDPTVYAFAPMQYVGTNFTNGSPLNSTCITGFDNYGFVLGTSSSLFNQILLYSNSTSLPTALVQVLQGILIDLSNDNVDIADYWPNPFYHYNIGSNVRAQDQRLTLVDGGEDGQNIPFSPLIQPERKVDVIFAVDSSADTNATWPNNGSAQNWPGGLSMMSTYRRQLDPIGNNTAFPSVPDTNTFFNLGLNNRPTFFGCNASNHTGDSDQTAPLIVYLPHAPYVYDSNFSTLNLQYNDTERDMTVMNGYYLATQANGTLDVEWPACVGCAMLSRSFDRTGESVPTVCSQCFERYCWNGTLDASTPKAYTPEFRTEVVSAASGGGAPLKMAIAGAVAAGLALT